MHIYQFYKYTIALYVYPNRNILLHYNILTPVLSFNSLINSSFFIQSPKFLIITTGLFRFIYPILQYTFLSPIILLKHIKHYLPTYSSHNSSFTYYLYLYIIFFGFLYFIYFINRFNIEIIYFQSNILLS